jgi:predicted amidophosphoribosyltransferase
VEGVTHRFDKNNVSQFLDMVPRAMAAAILPRIEGTATLVPIPNSHVLKPDEPNFQTLKLATGIAAASGGRLKADVALVFTEPQEKARKGGPRSASHLEEAYRIIGNVEGPLILVDDVWTMGGHLRAACRKLAYPRRPVILACTVAHTTHERVDKPVGVQEHTIDLTRLHF